MKLVLILSALIVVAGFFMGWFNFSAHNEEGGSQANVTLTVDKDKIVSDKDKVVDQMHYMGHNSTDTKTPTPPTDQE